MATNTITSKPASDKQLAFIAKLASEKVWEDNTDGNVFERIFDVATRSGKFISSREASAAIDALLACPRKPQPKVEGQWTLEPGVYVMPDGCIVKAQENKAKTNVYTQRWTEIRGERLVDATEKRVHGEWTYAPELKRGITADMRMSLEQAREFILRYGQCARCSRRLKAAESVERGIGPVCVKYFSF